MDIYEEIVKLRQAGRHGAVATIVNVRELANVIERAVVLGQGSEISVHDLPSSTVGLAEKNDCASLSYRGALEMAKRDVVLRALAQTDGNRAAAARLLGLHKTHLLNLIKSLRID